MGDWIAEGQRAPAFTLASDDGSKIRLSDLKGGPVVLYFYPKDDTPGCTVEANQFTALADEFARAGTAVIGVSRDSCASHQAFISKYGLKVDLLADEDGQMCEDYGVWQEKEKDGVKRMGILRSTFLIDKHGRLAEVMYGVTADGHAAAMLEKARHLG